MLMAGQVGEQSINVNTKHFTSAKDGKKAFAKKFKECTGNVFAPDVAFRKKSSRYNRIDLRQDEDSTDADDDIAILEVAAATAGGGRAAAAAATAGSTGGGGGGKEKGKRKQKPVDAVNGGAGTVATAPLSPSVRSVVSKIFDATALKSAMDAMAIDPTRMPLGKLSKKSIIHGYRVLKQLEEVIDAGASGMLDASVRKARTALLSTEFYHVVPHVSQGLRKLPDIATKELWKAKVTLLNDMYVAALVVTFVQAVPSVNLQYVFGV